MGLTRRLREATTQAAWNEVLASMAEALSLHERTALGINDPTTPEWRTAEISMVRLGNLLREGFKQPPNRNREDDRARHDARTIAVWSGARTLAEAEQFLMRAYHLTKSKAASRLRAARKMGLDLPPAPRGGKPKKSPTL